MSSTEAPLLPYLLFHIPISVLMKRKYGDLAHQPSEDDTPQVPVSIPQSSSSRKRRSIPRFKSATRKTQLPQKQAPPAPSAQVFTVKETKSYIKLAKTSIVLSHNTDPSQVASSSKVLVEDFAEPEGYQPDLGNDVAAAEILKPKRKSQNNKVSPSTIPRTVLMQHAPAVPLVQLGGIPSR